MWVQRPDLQWSKPDQDPSFDRTVLAKGERETGSYVPSTKHRVEFIYRLGPSHIT